MTYSLHTFLHLYKSNTKCKGQEHHVRIPKHHNYVFENSVEEHDFLRASTITIHHHHHHHNHHHLLKSAFSILWGVIVFHTLMTLPPSTSSYLKHPLHFDQPHCFLPFPYLSKKSSVFLSFLCHPLSDTMLFSQVHSIICIMNFIKQTHAYLIQPISMFPIYVWIVRCLDVGSRSYCWM